MNSIFTGTNFCFQLQRISIILILFPLAAHSQTNQKDHIEGKVSNENFPVHDVLVTNSTSQKFATTNIEGVFKIEATIGDTLIFSHLSFSTFNETVTDVMLKLELVPVQVSDKINKLDEVTVNAFPTINALSLRIIDHEIENLTTNERRLKTAGDFKPIHLLSLLGGSLAIDPIINKNFWKNR